MITAAKEAYARAAVAPPSVGTAAKETNTTLVRDQASTSIIFRGTFFIDCGGAGICVYRRANAEVARTVLLRPMPHHDARLQANDI